MERAPEFRLPVLHGEPQEIALSDYCGKVLLVNFWVTWCPACQQELPQKEVFYRSLDNEQLAFITINVTGREADPQQVKPYIAKHRLTFPVLRDKGTNTYDAYKVTSVPTTVLINPKGEIVNRYDETVPFVTVLEELGAYLNG